MRKKNIAKFTALSMMLVLALTGCGKNTDNKPVDPTIQTSETEKIKSTENTSEGIMDGDISMAETNDTETEIEDTDEVVVTSDVESDETNHETEKETTRGTVIETTVKTTETEEPETTANETEKESETEKETVPVSTEETRKEQEPTKEPEPTKETIKETIKETAATEITKEPDAEITDPTTPATSQAAVHVHKYEEMITKTVTCSTDGIKQFTCTCGDTYTEIYQRKTGEHKYGNYYSTGIDDHARLCSVCGYEEKSLHSISHVGDSIGINSKCSLCEYNRRVLVYADYITQELALTNQARLDAGLPEFHYNSDAQYLADRRAREIVADYSHDGLLVIAQSEPRVFYNYHAGENIYRGNLTPEQAHLGWMASEGHRQNILNPEFTSVTIGVYFDINTNKHHIVQIFGDK